MSTADQILASMESGALAYGKFADQVPRLVQLQKRAATTCSHPVSQPFATANYKFSLANARWSLCAADCDMTGITQNVRSGQALLHRAVLAASRTE